MRHEPCRLQLHFQHPSADNFFNLLKHAYPDTIRESVKQILKQIAISWEHRRGHIPAPMRFRAFIQSEKILLNHELAMDIIWIELVPLIYIVNTHKGFQNATVLRNKTTADIWSSFVEFWVSFYCGYPTTIRLNHESGFTSKMFLDLATGHGLNLHFLGMQPHNSIGYRETYHKPLRRFFRVLRQRYTNIKAEELLRYAAKGLNDSMGSKRLVPRSLVFGNMPSFLMTTINV